MPAGNEGVTDEAREQARLFASLIGIRGFITDAERAQMAAAGLEGVDPVMEGSIARIGATSAGGKEPEADQVLLAQLAELRWTTASRCLAALTATDTEILAGAMKVPLELIQQVRATVTSAQNEPEHTRSVSVRAALERLEAARDPQGPDLVRCLSRQRRWPGDPGHPTVRAYLDALNAAVLRHSRLAISRGKRWMHTPSPALLLAALHGLREALERFDPTRGTRIATYAEHRIRQAVQRGQMDFGTSIRTPVHTVERLTRLRRSALTAVVKGGRPPPLIELLRDGESVEGISNRLAAPVSPWWIRRADGELEIDHLGLDEQTTVAREELRHSLGELIDLEIENMSVRARDILSRRFRLRGQSEIETLEAIGESYGISRERIRQIERLTLDKLSARIGDRLAQLRR